MLFRERAGLDVRKFVSVVTVLFFAFEQIVFAAPPSSTIRENSGIDQPFIELNQAPRRTAANPSSPAFALTSDQFLGSDSPLSPVDKVPSQVQSPETVQSPSQQKSAVPYEAERYSFEEALEQLRPEYASAVIVKDLTESDLRQLENLSFETGILVLHGEIVLFTSGSEDEIGVLPAAKALAGKSALISHTHPGIYSEEGPSGEDINEAASYSGQAYVLARQGVYAYNGEGVLNNGNPYGYEWYLEKIRQALNDTQADRDQVAARRDLNEFIKAQDEYNEAPADERLTFQRGGTLSYTGGLTASSVTTFSGNPYPYINTGSSAGTTLSYAASTNQFALGYNVVTAGTTSGFSISFDNAGTPAVETQNIGGLTYLTFGLKGPNTAVGLQIVDINGNKDTWTLTNISNAAERFWRIPTASIAGTVDKTRIKQINFIVSQANTTSTKRTGTLSIRSKGENTSAPSQPVVTSSVPAITNQTTLTLSGTKEANTSILINNVQVVASDASTTWSATVNLGTEGNNTINVTAKNSIGLLSGVKTLTVLRDTVKPAGSLNINSGAAYAASGAVTLNLSASDSGSGMSQMSFSADNVTWSAAETYATSKAWTFPGGDGSKTVYVRYIDRAGNVSAVYSKSIILDTLPPSGTLTVNGGAQYITQTAVTLNLSAADAGSGLDKMSFSSNGTTWTSAEPYAATKAWTFGTGDGNKTVYVKYLDKSGKWSPPISVTVLLDTVKPTGSVNINSGAAYATSATVTLNLSATDGGSGVGTVSFSTNNSTWSTPESYTTARTFSLQTGDGTKTVYVKYYDKAGNVSAVYSKSITLDTAIPTGSININSGAVYAASQTVTLNLSAADAGSGINAMSFSADNVNWLAPETYAASKTYSLSAGDGTKTVNVKYYDKAGNVSAVYSKSIILDTLPPSGTLTVNGGAQYVTQTAVTLNLSAADAGSGLDKMSFSNDNITWTTAETYAATKAWTFGTGDGNKTVYVKYLDKSGKWSTPISVTVLLDTVKPTGSININSGAAYATSGSVTLNLSAADSGSGVGSMSFSTDNTSWTAPENYSTSKAFSLSAGDGSKTVSVKYFDKAGNVSVVSSKSIILDTVAPVVVLTPAPPSLINVKTLTVAYTLDGVAKTKVFANLAEGMNRLTITETDAAGNNTIKSFDVTVDTVAPVISTITGPSSVDGQDVQIQWTVQSAGDVRKFVYTLQLPDSSILSGETTSLNKQFSGLQAEGAYHFILKAQDSAGNFSEAKTFDFTVTRTPPVITVKSPALTNHTQYQFDIELAQGSAKRNFTESMSLTEGRNDFSRTYTSPGGRPLTADFTIWLDSTPPAIVFTSPAVAGDPFYTLTYTVDGIKKSEQRILSRRTNQITVTETDAAGNIGYQTLTVNLDAPDLVFNADGILVSRKYSDGSMDDFGYLYTTEGNVTKVRVERTIPKAIGPGIPQVNPVTGKYPNLSVYSAGYDDGWNAALFVDEQGVGHSNYNYGANNAWLGRGYDVAVVNPADGTVAKSDLFDLYSKGQSESQRMADFINSVPEGYYVLMAVMDEGSVALTEAAKTAIESIGSSKIRDIDFRSSWAIIGRKGAAKGTAIEDLKTKTEGPVSLESLDVQHFYYDASGHSLSYDQFTALPKSSWTSTNQTHVGSDTEILASTAAGDAAAYRKVYNNLYPESGFVQIWRGSQNDSSYFTNANYLQDLYNLLGQVHAKAVYYDSRYPSSYIPASAAAAFKQQLQQMGYQVLDADQLAAYLQANGPDTAVVLAQDIAPDTVYQPFATPPSNSLRGYMERGGTIVWPQDQPFFYVGHSNGKMDFVGEIGTKQALGVVPLLRSVYGYVDRSVYFEPLPTNWYFPVSHAKSIDGKLHMTGTGLDWSVSAYPFDYLPAQAVPFYDVDLSSVRSGSEFMIGFEGNSNSNEYRKMAVHLANGVFSIENTRGTSMAVLKTAALKPGTDYTVQFHNLSGPLLMGLYEKGSDVPVMEYELPYNDWADFRVNAAVKKGELVIEDVRTRIKDSVVQSRAGATFAPLYDVTPPSVELSVSSQLGILYSNTVALSLTAADTQSGASEMRFSEDGIRWSDWEKFASVKNISLPPGNGPRILYAQVRDHAGNISENAEVSFLLDVPPDSSALISYNGDNGTVFNYLDDRLYSLQKAGEYRLINPELDENDNLTGGLIFYDQGGVSSIHSDKLVWHLDPQGNRYEYDSDQRIVRLTETNKEETDFIRFTDPVSGDLLTQARQDDVTTTYDSKGIIRRIDYQNGDHFVYENGKLRSVELSDGVTIHYRPENSSVVLDSYAPQNYPARIDYDAQGQISLVVGQTGAKTEFKNGIPIAVNADGSQDSYNLETSEVGDFIGMTVNRFNYVQHFNEKGKLVAVDFAEDSNLTLNPGRLATVSKIGVEDGKIKEIKLADGTSVTFAGDGYAEGSTQVTNGVIRSADGSSARYADGQLVEITTRDSTRYAVSRQGDQYQATQAADSASSQSGPSQFILDSGLHVVQLSRQNEIVRMREGKIDSILPNCVVGRDEGCENPRYFYYEAGRTVVVQGVFTSRPDLATLSPQGGIGYSLSTYDLQGQMTGLQTVDVTGNAAKDSLSQAEFSYGKIRQITRCRIDATDCRVLMEYAYTTDSDGAEITTITNKETLEKREYKGNKILRAISAENVVTLYTYGADGRLASSVMKWQERELDSFTYRYDRGPSADGEGTIDRTLITDSKGITRIYDPDTVLIGVIQGNQEFRIDHFTEGSEEKTVQEMIRQTNADGVVYHYKMGKITRIEYPDGTSVEDIIEEANGGIFSARITNPDGSSGRITNGTTVEIVRPDGTIWRYESGKLVSRCDVYGHTWKYEDGGTDIFVTDSAGNERHYDSAGQWIETVSTDGKARLAPSFQDAMTYDQLMVRKDLHLNVMSLKDALGADFRRVQVLDKTLRSGAVVKFTDLGMIDYVQAADQSRITEIVADSSGKVTQAKVTLPSGIVGIFNEQGLTEEILPDGTHFYFDGYRIKKAVDHNGVELFYSYDTDLWGNVTAVWVNKGNANLQYDAGGNLRGLKVDHVTPIPGNPPPADADRSYYQFSKVTDAAGKVTGYQFAGNGGTILFDAAGRLADLNLVAPDPSAEPNVFQAEKNAYDQAALAADTLQGMIAALAGSPSFDAIPFSLSAGYDYRFPSWYGDAQNSQAEFVNVTSYDYASNGLLRAATHADATTMLYRNSRPYELLAPNGGLLAEYQLDVTLLSLPTMSYADLATTVTETDLNRNSGLTRGKVISHSGDQVSVEDEKGNILTYSGGVLTREILAGTGRPRTFAYTKTVTKIYESGSEKDFNAAGDLFQFVDFKGKTYAVSPVLSGGRAESYLLTSDAASVLLATDGSIKQILSGSVVASQFLDIVFTRPNLPYDLRSLQIQGTVSVTPLFMDASDAAHDLTVHGTAYADTTDSRFGQTSAYFDGSGSYVSAPDSDDWNFGGGDFTVDSSFKTLDNSVSRQILVSQTDDVNNRWYLALESDNSAPAKLRFFAIQNGVVIADISHESVVSAETWHHAAIVRKGNAFSLYLDGKASTAAVTTSAAMPALAGELTIGGQAGAAACFGGWLDEFRISKGIARWNANFSVKAPVADSHTKLLLFQTDKMGDVFSTGSMTAGFDQPKIQKDFAAARMNPDEVLYSVFDQDGQLVYTRKVNGITTQYVDGRITFVWEKSGRLLQSYEYDTAGNPVKITQNDMREQMPVKMQAARETVEKEKANALRILAQRQNQAVDTIQQEYEKSRKALYAQRANLESQRYRRVCRSTMCGEDCEEVEVAGVQDAINQVNDAINRLNTDEVRAYADLGDQVEAAKEQLNAQTLQAYLEIDRQESDFKKAIVRQEISPIIFNYYRANMGRDPSEEEYDLWVETLNYGETFDIAKLTRVVKGLDILTVRDSKGVTRVLDYSRELAKTTASVKQVQNAVTDFINVYKNKSREEKVQMARARWSVLEGEDVLDFTSAEGDAILKWLNGCSLHFGQSAFIALEHLLAQAGITYESLAARGIVFSREELATELILIDIVAGIINPFQEGDLVISLYAMKLLAKKLGADTSGLRTSLDDLENFYKANENHKVIAHINGNHYVIITGVYQVFDTETGQWIRKIRYIDPGAGVEGDPRGLDQSVTGHQVMEISEREFLQVWAGVVLCLETTAQALITAHQSNPNLKANPPPQVLVKSEEQAVRGSFFFFLIPFFAFVFSAVATVVATVTAVISAIAGVIAGAIAGVLGVIGEVGSLIAGAIQSAILGIVGGLETVATAFLGFATSVLQVIPFVGPALSGVVGAVGNFAIGFMSTFMTGFASTVLGGISSHFIVGVIGLTQLFGGPEAILTALGVPPKIAHYIGIGINIVGAIATGNPYAIASTITSTAIKEIGPSLGLSKDLTNALSIAASALAGTIAQGAYDPNMTITRALKDAAPDLQKKFISAGLTAIGEIGGLDPRLRWFLDRGATIVIRSAIDTLANPSGGGGPPLFDQMKSLLREGAAVAADYLLDKAGLPAGLGDALGKTSNALIFAVFGKSPGQDIGKAFSDHAGDILKQGAVYGVTVLGKKLKLDSTLTDLAAKLAGNFIESTVTDKPLEGDFWKYFGDFVDAGAKQLVEKADVPQEVADFLKVLGADIQTAVNDRDKETTIQTVLAAHTADLFKVLAIFGISQMAPHLGLNNENTKIVSDVMRNFAAAIVDHKPLDQVVWKGLETYVIAGVSKISNHFKLSTGLAGILGAAAGEIVSAASGQDPKKTVAGVIRERMPEILKGVAVHGISKLALSMEFDSKLADVAQKAVANFVDAFFNHTPLDKNLQQAFYGFVEYAADRVEEKIGDAVDSLGRRFRFSDSLVALLKTMALEMEPENIGEVIQQHLAELVHEFGYFGIERMADELDLKNEQAKAFKDALDQLQQGVSLEAVAWQGIDQFVVWSVGKLSKDLDLPVALSGVLGKTVSDLTSALHDPNHQTTVEGVLNKDLPALVEEFSVYGVLKLGGKLDLDSKRAQKIMTDIVRGVFEKKPLDQVLWPDLADFIKRSIDKLAGDGAVPALKTILNQITDAVTAAETDNDPNTTMGSVFVLFSRPLIKVLGEYGMERFGAFVGLKKEFVEMAKNAIGAALNGDPMDSVLTGVFNDFLIYGEDQLGKYLSDNEWMSYALGTDDLNRLLASKAEEMISSYLGKDNFFAKLYGFLRGGVLVPMNLQGSAAADSVSRLESFDLNLNDADFKERFEDAQFSILDASATEEVFKKGLSVILSRPCSQAVLPDGATVAELVFTPYFSLYFDAAGKLIGRKTGGRVEIGGFARNPEKQFGLLKGSIYLSLEDSWKGRADIASGRLVKIFAGKDLSAPAITIAGDDSGSIVVNTQFALEAGFIELDGRSKFTVKEGNVVSIAQKMIDALRGMQNSTEPIEKGEMTYFMNGIGNQGCTDQNSPDLPCYAFTFRDKLLATDVFKKIAMVPLFVGSDVPSGALQWMQMLVLNETENIRAIVDRIQSDLDTGVIKENDTINVIAYSGGGQAFAKAIQDKGLKVHVNFITLGSPILWTGLSSKIDSFLYMFGTEDMLKYLNLSPVLGFFAWTVGYAAVMWAQLKRFEAEILQGYEHSATAGRPDRSYFSTAEYRPGVSYIDYMIRKIVGFLI
jgi:hypothetical protein